MAVNFISSFLYSVPRHALKFTYLLITLDQFHYVCNNTQLFLLINVMVTMIATTNTAISVYLLYEHILKLVLGAFVHHKNLVADECSQ